MASAETESISSLSIDLFYNILKRLDGPTLASAACTCSAFSSISREERLWEDVCSSLWPSTNNKDVKILISSIGGFRKFFADSFPLIVNNQVPDIHYQWTNYDQEWTEAEYYGDTNDPETVSPSDFISLVDVKYRDRTVISKVLWGIPDANGFNGWFYSCPFMVDLLGDDGGVSITVNGSLPSMDRERKDGKLWRELRDGVRLSWIVVNRKMKQAANLASWCPLGGQRHWPTDNDFVLRFRSVLPAKDIVLPYGVVECIILMKLRVVGGSLKMTELTMQLEDMEGAHVNGRNSLVILKEALSCRRSKDYSAVLECCNLYSKVQSELKEEKMRNENRLDRICIFGGIAAAATFCYYYAF